MSWKPIVVGVDVSHAAERYAALCSAKLRALSVVEPPAVLPEVPQQDTTDYYRRWEETLAAAWSADLVVVAMYGKGPVARMLAGSVTEGLINHLPTSLLVVPAGAGGAALEPDAAELITVKHEEET